MGFLNAVLGIGELSSISGWEAHLKFPLEVAAPRQGKVKKDSQAVNDGHKIIRVWLEVDNPDADQLKVKGVKKIDLIDYKTSPEMKIKYLYRDRVGANTFWGFTPIFKMGKPKKDALVKRRFLLGESGEWQRDEKSLFNKLKNRLLSDFETSGVISMGSVGMIMDFLIGHTDEIVDLFHGDGSFLLIFGVNNNEKFLFPGEIPAFVSYFKDKLDQHVQEKKDSKGGRVVCFCCGKETDKPATLDKVFKFATFDKVNILPGLDKNNDLKVMPVCQDCLEQLSAGREKIEREFADKSTIKGVIIWFIPEVIGIEGTKDVLIKAVKQLNVEEKGAMGLGREGEKRFFHRLTRQDASIVFHFLFWERLNAQERIHLMVEDVPPSRLSRLENSWITAVEKMGANWDKRLDTAFETLYLACMAFSGQSNEDKTVMRDFVIKLIGKMMKEEKLPVESFKSMFVRRIPKLVFDSDKWSNVRYAARRAQVIIEFMEQLNKGGSTIEPRSEVS